MVKNSSNNDLKRLHKQEYGPIEAECDSISKDRLTKLPDEILVHIISFLPLKEAVRTILLRRFRNLWTLLPNLVFRDCSATFVNNVMKYHKNPIIDTWEFFSERDEGEFSEKKVQKWARLASFKNPKVFGISLCYFELWDLKLPRIFTSQSIMTLKFTYVEMNLPCRVNMRSLRRLELRYVVIVEEDLKALEVGCPCLQELFIENPRGLRKVHFTAPNIENLVIEFDVGYEDELHSLDCPNLKYLHLKDTCLNPIELLDLSSVTCATISDLDYSVTDHQFQIVYEKFQNAEYLFFRDNGDAEYIKLPDIEYHLLGDEGCMQLELFGYEKLVFQLNNWSLVALKSGVQRSHLLGICRLLRISSSLQELILYVDVDFFCDYNLLLQDLSPPCKMQYLKTVTIRDFKKQCKILVQLMEFLLNNAVVLDKLVIVCNKKEQLTSTEAHEFAMELLRLPRASKNARVVIA